jgi:hypothetical protein
MWQFYEERKLRQQGFKVVEEISPNSDTALGNFSDADVYGVVAVAHGDPSNHGDYLCSDTYRVSPSAALSRLHHRLGGLKLVICWGKAKEKEWLTVVSPNGMLWSYAGKLHPYNARQVPYGFQDP